MACPFCLMAARYCWKNASPNLARKKRSHDTKIIPCIFYHPPQKQAASTMSPVYSRAIQLGQGKYVARNLASVVYPPIPSKTMEIMTQTKEERAIPNRMGLLFH